ncbi:MAG: OmpA family protein [Deltaproteobacteria bacterium]|nr:OmpA family protein [Deltaproteobacteria bacterium]MBN2674372.1 OmpA family protein [Deltaproteobacteria bacterium]
MFFRNKIIMVVIPALLIGGAVISGCNEKVKTDLDKCKQEMFILQKESRDCSTTVERLSQEAEEAKSRLTEAESLKAEMEKRQKQQKERLDTIRQILDQLKMNIESGDLKVRIKRGKMALELPSAVLFESGKADLSEKGQETLASVAKVLKGIRGREFQVAGHTDNVKVSEDNPFGDNWHLSTARAVSVVLFLKGAGVNPRDLSAAGYAQYQPAASNRNKMGKSRNRRIEITLMPNLKELPDLSELEEEFDLKEPPAPEEE